MLQLGMPAFINELRAGEDKRDKNPSDGLFACSHLGQVPQSVLL